MKRATVVLSSLALVVSLAAVPALAKVDLDLGVKGGLSISKFRFSEGGPDVPVKSISKPVFGVFLAVNLNRTFSIQPEVYYLTQGGKMEEEFDGDTYRIDIIVNYIHVPVLAKVHLVKEGDLRPILFAGPAFGFRGSAKQKYYLNGSFEGEKDVKSMVKSSNLSAVFGGGLEYSLSKLMLILDVRYDVGLSNLDNTDGSTKIKTGAFMIMAGLGF